METQQTGINKNPPHRPPGSPNKATAKARALFQSVIENSLERIQTELNSLHGKDYINAVASLAEFVLPKLNRVEHTDADGGPRVVKIIHSLQPPEKPSAAIENTDYIVIPNTGDKKPF
jgi:hypothetical protein